MHFSPIFASLFVTLVSTTPVYGQSSTSDQSSSQSASATSSASQPSASVQPPSQLISDLQNSGFSGFAGALNQLSGSADGNELFSKLQADVGNDNYLVFAPSDDAISNIPSSVTQNTTLLADYLSYYFVQGQFNASAPNDTSSDGQSSRARGLFGRLLVPRQDSSGGVQPIAGVYPNVTIGRTLLNASDLVQLEGDRSQVIVWDRSGPNGNITIENQAENITVQSSTQAGPYLIAGINGTLIPPGNLTTALTAVNASVAQALLSSVQVPGSGANATSVTVIEALQEARGITVFVPNNDAFTVQFNETLPSLQNDTGKLSALLQNHYVNGTTIYSTEIGDGGSVVTAGGKQYQFINNATGIFVKGSNGTVAQVVRPNVLLNNGVAHIVNGIFFDTNYDTNAAVSAYSAASSAATESTSATGPITAIVGGGSVPSPAITQQSSGSASQTTVASSTSIATVTTTASS